jgi:hemerythrin-like domain-containing protein
MPTVASDQSSGEHLAHGAPADTRMMGIVHRAIRRDLERARVVLGATPAPGDRQRAAVGDQLRWVLAFLEAHHRSEDEGLYPVVRERRPDAAALLDDMAADHAAVALAVHELEEELGVGTPDDPAAVVAAIEHLEAVLLPHLRREEDEVLPVVSAAITDAEWRAIEQEHNLDGKSMRQLGREGHWLIDGADPDDRAAVLGLVPAVPRFLLVHGFGPSYRRSARACWEPGARREVQRTGTTSVVVDADIDAVWRVVTDVTRTGEWSHECVGCTWLGGATEAVPGARFRGRNRQRVFRWGRVCEVLSAEPHELVWRTVPTTLFPDSSEWSIRLVAEDGGTRVEQAFRVLEAPPRLIEAAYATMLPAHRDRTVALQEDLRRLGGLA